MRKLISTGSLFPSENSLNRCDRSWYLLLVPLQATPVHLLLAMASRVITALGDSIIHGSTTPHQEQVEEASGLGLEQEEHLDTFLEVKG